MTIVWMLTFVVLSVLIALGYFVWRSTRPTRLDFTPEWAESFRPSRYRPMERLLSEDDYRFLLSRPGINRKEVSRLRAERRAIFRIFLSQVSRDFNRLLSVGKLMVVYAPEDRPDLAKALLNCELRFRWTLAVVHVRLILHSFGLGAVDAGRLVAALETVADAIRAPQLQAAPASV